MSYRIIAIGILLIVPKEETHVKLKSKSKASKKILLKMSSAEWHCVKCHKLFFIYLFTDGSQKVRITKIQLQLTIWFIVAGRTIHGNKDHGAMSQRIKI